MLHNLADREFAERAALRQLNYRGFVRTAGSCCRCGKAPDGTGCLHAVFDPAKNNVLEYGVYCFPTYLIPALQAAFKSETDVGRKESLRRNLDAILRHRDYPKDLKRCNVAAEPRANHEMQAPLPLDQCLLGGYTFILQAVGGNTFTVRL